MFKEKEKSVEERTRVSLWVTGSQGRPGASARIRRLLSDQCVRLWLAGGRSSAETRWLHKHAVARRAAEVRSALDSPVVLPCGGNQCHTLRRWPLLIIIKKKQLKESTGFCKHINI